MHLSSHYLQHDPFNHHESLPSPFPSCSPFYKMLPLTFCHPGSYLSISLHPFPFPLITLRCLSKLLVLLILQPVYTVKIPLQLSLWFAEPQSALDMHIVTWHKNRPFGPAWPCQTKCPSTLVPFPLKSFLFVWVIFNTASPERWQAVVGQIDFRLKCP